MTASSTTTIPPTPGTPSPRPKIAGRFNRRRPFSLLLPNDVKRRHDVEDSQSVRGAGEERESISLALGSTSTLLGERTATTEASSGAYSPDHSHSPSEVSTIEREKIVARSIPSVAPATRSFRPESIAGDSIRSSESSGSRRIGAKLGALFHFKNRASGGRLRGSTVSGETGSRGQPGLVLESAKHLRSFSVPHAALEHPPVTLPPPKPHPRGHGALIEIVEEEDPRNSSDSVDNNANAAMKDAAATENAVGGKVGTDDEQNLRHSEDGINCVRAYAQEPSRGTLQQPSPSSFPVSSTSSTTPTPTATSGDPDTLRGKGSPLEDSDSENTPRRPESHRSASPPLSSPLANQPETDVQPRTPISVIESLQPSSLVISNTSRVESPQYHKGE